MSKKDFKNEIRMYGNSYLDGIQEQSTLLSEESVAKIKQFFDSFVDSQVDCIYLNELDDNPWLGKNWSNCLITFLRRYGDGDGYYKYKDTYFAYETIFKRVIKKVTLESITSLRDNHVAGFSQYPRLYEDQIHIINDIYGVRDLEKLLDYDWLKSYTYKYKELYDKLVDIELEKQDYFLVKESLLSTKGCRPREE